MRRSLLKAMLVTPFCSLTTITRLTCPVCKKPIKQGQMVAHVFDKGVLIPIHFQHAFDRFMADRFKGLKK